MKGMKAWIVSDTTYDWTEVIFAPTRHEAFYKSDGYQNDGYYTEMRGRRKKEWDQYAELGYVPREVMFQDGWWFECDGFNDRGYRCCKQLTIDDNPLAIGDHAYCNQECADGKRATA